MHRPKKSLGQNFLKSKEALLKIIDAGDIKADDIVLEVGPGKGALTDYLVKLAGKVIAVEKDRELIPLLLEKYHGEITENKFDLIEQDILEFDPNQLKQLDSKNTGVTNNSYKIIANIPYYITGALIQKFLTAHHQPERMVLLLQKEVAQRIVARNSSKNLAPEKESILSMSVKAYGTPKYIGTVKAKYFSPQPKVDSGILLIENISRDFFSDLSEDKFFEIMKAGFAHKRKMLLGNLKEHFVKKDEKNSVVNESPLPAGGSNHLEEIFEKTNINKKARAEDLTLEQWKRLVREI
jgi:16S rRNA (adenine1518-N6/adenine1519-N6)-dimethyltransferase